MTLLIDDREDSKTVNKICRHEFFAGKFEIRRLDVGDYLFENDDKSIVICFERKSIQDFVGSIFSGRLEKQLLQQENSYTRNYLIIVGEWRVLAFDNHFQSFSVNHRLGTMASLAVRHSTKVVQVDNPSQFVDMLQKIIEKSTDGKVLGDTPFLKRMSIDNVYIAALCAFPNIAEEKSRKIVEKYPSFTKLQNALRDDSFEVNGCGDKIVEQLKKVLINE